MEESIRKEMGMAPKTEEPAAPEMTETAESQGAAQDEYSEATQSSIATPRAAYDRKIIRTAQFDIEVEDASKAYQQVVVMAETMGGFVQESAQQADGARLRAHLIVRIPVDSFRRAIEELNALGTIENQRLSGQDVTEEYVDLESRTRTLRAKEDRLMQILGEANTVDEILKVERELWSVREQIEQLQGRLRYLDDLTSLATLQINLYEPPAVPSEDEPDSLIEQLVRAFVNSLKYMGYYAGRVLIALTWVLPYAVVAVVVWWLVKRLLWRKPSEE
jgi:hypothetical protein